MIFENDNVITSRPEREPKPAEYESAEVRNNLPGPVAALLVDVIAALLPGRLYVNRWAAKSVQGSNYILGGIARQIFGNVGVHYVAELNVQGRTQVVDLGRVLEAILAREAYSAILSIVQTWFATSEVDGSVRFTEAEFLAAFRGVRDLVTAECAGIQTRVRDLDRHFKA